MKVCSSARPTSRSFAGGGGRSFAPYGYVQRIGDQPGNTSEAGTEIYGVGALLLAGSEVYRLAQR